MDSVADDKRTLRIGKGQLTDGYGYQALQLERQHFLDAVVEVEPAVLDTLAAAPLAAARRVWAPSHDGSAPSDVLVEEMWRAIAVWRRQWELGPVERHWTLFAAEWTLFGWVTEERAGQPRTDALSRFPEDHPSLLVLGPQLYDLPDAFVLQASPMLHWSGLPFPPASWNPRLETRAEATRRIRKELNTHLAMLMDKVEAGQRSRFGDIATPTKRTGTEHFLWLARYQVTEASYNQIARESFKGVQTVRDAIIETASSIGLPLRDPLRGGRPRKD